MTLGKEGHKAQPREGPAESDFLAGPTDKVHIAEIALV